MENKPGKMAFYHQYENGSPITLVKMRAGAPLGEVLEAFEAFLRASGYVFDGQVDIIEIERVPQDPNAEAN